VDRQRCGDGRLHTGAQETLDTLVRANYTHRRVAVFDDLAAEATRVKLAQLC
jgi:hypothetical protein